MALPQCTHIHMQKRNDDDDDDINEGGRSITHTDASYVYVFKI